MQNDPLKRHKPIEQGHSEHYAREFVRYGSVPSGAIVNGSFAENIGVFGLLPHDKESSDA